MQVRRGSPQHDRRATGSAGAAEGPGAQDVAWTDTVLASACGPAGASLHACMLISLTVAFCMRLETFFW